MQVTRNKLLNTLKTEIAGVEHLLQATYPVGGIREILKTESRNLEQAAEISVGSIPWNTGEPPPLVTFLAT